jgi:hypothetical protein
MSTLIALVMAVAVTSALVDLVRGEDALWRRALTLLLAVPPVALAIGRVVPSAVRLGAATDPAVVQSQLARSICHDHLLCLASITALLVLQLAARRH